MTGEAKRFHMAVGRSVSCCCQQAWLPLPPSGNRFSFTAAPRIMTQAAHPVIHITHYHIPAFLGLLMKVLGCQSAIVSISAAKTSLAGTGGPHGD